MRRTLGAMAILVSALGFTDTAAADQALTVPKAGGGYVRTTTDAQGNTTRTTQLDESGKPTRRTGVDPASGNRTETSYDEGVRRKRDTFDRKRRTPRREDFRADGRKNSREDLTYREDGSATRVTVSWDEDGRISSPVSGQQDAQDSSTGVTTTNPYEWWPKGKLERLKREPLDLDSLETTVIGAAEFDQNGNPTKREGRTADLLDGLGTSQDPNTHTTRGAWMGMPMARRDRGSW